MKTKMWGVVVGITVAMLAGVGVWADVPSTQPDAVAKTATTTRPSPAMNFGQWRRLWGIAGAIRAAGVRPYTQEEWNEMMAFMEEHSPARAHVLSSLQLRPNSPFRLDAIQRWRNYNFTVEHFPDVKDLLLKRIQLEDDLFALTVDAQSAGETDSVYIRDRIRSKIAEIVQLDFSQREARIEKLEKMLDDEKARLEADQSSMDQTIDRRTNQIMDRLEGLNRALAASASTQPSSSGEAKDNGGGDSSNTQMMNLNTGGAGQK
jgi:hypothetical protein